MAEAKKKILLFFRRHLCDEITLHSDPAENRFVLRSFFTDNWIRNNKTSKGCQSKLWKSKSKTKLRRKCRKVVEILTILALFSIRAFPTTTRVEIYVSYVFCWIWHFSVQAMHRIGKFLIYVESFGSYAACVLVLNEKDKSYVKGQKISKTVI